MDGLKSVQKYADGLVRYMQGLMAKDSRDDGDFFETFLERFNQSAEAIKQYDTEISRSVRAVIDFNRNDFMAISKTGLPLLDSATDFFKGGAIGRGQGVSGSKHFPVDYASEIIVTKLLPIYSSGSLVDLESEILKFSSKWLSLQDKMKFNYICYRKSVDVQDLQAAKSYKKLLKYDDAFSAIIENDDE